MSKLSMKTQYKLDWKIASPTDTVGLSPNLSQTEKLNNGGTLYQCNFPPTDASIKAFKNSGVTVTSNPQEFDKNSIYFDVDTRKGITTKYCLDNKLEAVVANGKESQKALSEAPLTLSVSYDG